jgi:hypothetical protein
MSLPRRLDWTLAQDRWASQLEPIIAAPSNNSSILKSVSLATGSNTISHGLGRQLQGWSIVRLRGSATIYDTQDSNPTPALTLVLVASAPVSVDIEVF